MFMRRLLIGLGKAAFALAVLMTGSLSAQAESGNPFGFETDTHPLKVESCHPIDADHLHSRHWYECTSAPRSHPQLRRYLLRFVEGVGLCTIFAESVGYKFEDIGIESVRITGQIERKYGIFHRDGMENGKHAVQWNRESGFDGLGDVESISLSKYNLKDGKGWRVTITFRLVTSSACGEQSNRSGYQAF